MTKRNMNAEEIYIQKMSEVSAGVEASNSYIQTYLRKGSYLDFESATLQLRKAMECIALAAISPNKKAYEQYRSKADKNQDFRKDFNGSKMLKVLIAINKDFYPKALEKPVINNGVQHFGRKADIPFPQKKFEALYDRLGKFLHADNPWGADKGVNNLATDIPVAIANIKNLLRLHFTVIKSPEFTGVWVVEVPFEKGDPRIVVGKADGDFIVK